MFKLNVQRSTFLTVPHGLLPLTFTHIHLLPPGAGLLCEGYERNPQGLIRLRPVTGMACDLLARKHRQYYSIIRAATASSPRYPVHLPR